MEGGAIDLNMAPTSDEEEEERQESAVDTLRREREERKIRMKRQREQEPQKADVLPQAKKAAVDRRRDVGPLPEGWSDCPGAGEPIARLIPSKVPLGESFNELLEPGKRYSRAHVVRHQQALGRKVGLVIDLTNTSRYYNSNEWTKEGVKYVKVPCRGRNEVPDNELVNTFVHEVNRFLHQQQGKGAAANKYVLVHCTHGHNRTGFMIVHYLMRTQCSSVAQALRMFAEARPPGIYKQDYIDKLFTFYHERKPQSLVCPSTPEWKRPATVDLNEVASTDQDDDDEDDGGLLAALQEVDPKPEMTNDDVLGDAIPDEHQRDMQKICYWALGVQVHVGGNLHFPGSQPVSLDRQNLQLLRQKYYYATWKADGTRYMMLITREGCYLIDRNFRFRRVQLRFPVKGSRDTMAGTHHLTLLDGEMVIDKIKDGEYKRRYLIYDLMMLNQVSLAKLQFHERWKMIEKEVYEPRQQEEARNQDIYDFQAEPFRVRRKNFYMLSTTGKLLHNFIPKLSHEADGLIFQGWEDPYVPRTHEGLLKWKYAHMNSVDFVLKVSPTGTQYYLMLMEKGRLKQLENARVVFPEEEDVASMAGKVIECSYSPETGTWNFMRIRHDKETPNAFHVFRKVMGSIQDNITDEVLLEEINEIIRLPLYTQHMARDQQEAAQAAHARRR
ncbi:unnamed protein product [Sphagnum jensenii]|uniref:mRNA guanylyltransferase n=1 Tax=Sphagnum jensenii TaxID=128206 RepID=A0ABP0XFK6_9BRYO